MCMHPYDVLSVFRNGLDMGSGAFRRRFSFLFFSLLGSGSHGYVWVCRVRKRRSEGRWIEGPLGAWDTCLMAAPRSSDPAWRPSMTATQLLHDCVYSISYPVDGLTCKANINFQNCKALNGVL